MRQAETRHDPIVEVSAVPDTLRPSMKLRFPRQVRLIRWLVAGCAAFAVGLGVWLWMRPPPEPWLRGKSLTEWLELYATPGATERQRIEVSQAIREIGTNAGPFLLYLTDQKDPTRDRLNQFLKNRGWSAWADRVGFSDETSKRWLAECGFRLLSTNAASSVPELKRLALSPERKIGLSAIDSLWVVGREGQLALVSLLSDSNFVAGGLSPFVVPSLDHETSPIPEIVPAIFSAATNEHSYVRRASLDALDNIDGMTDAKTEILSRGMRDSDPRVVSRAIAALSRHPAVLVRLRAELSSLTNSPDKEVAKDALELLVENPSPDAR